MLDINVPSSATVTFCVVHLATEDDVHTIGCSMTLLIDTAQCAVKLSAVQSSLCPTQDCAWCQLIGLLIFHCCRCPVDTLVCCCATAAMFRINGLLPYREKDPDPDGKQLAGTKDPLGEATKLVQQLKQYAGDRIKTHLLAFEVSQDFRKI